VVIGIGVNPTARLWLGIDIVLPDGNFNGVTGALVIMQFITVLTSIIIVILIVLYAFSTSTAHGPVYIGTVVRTNWRARYYPTKLVNTQRVQA
jgi:hypothetical protein